MIKLADENFKIINTRVTYKNLPFHKLEKFTFKDVAVARDAFKKIPTVSECVIIQTHSRVEVIAIINLETEEDSDARRPEGKGLVLNKIKEVWLSLIELEQIDIDHLDQLIEVYQGRDVYRNLLRLACGLDSVIVGNETITGELKSSITSAKNSKSSGRVLNKLFDSAIEISNKIREATGISKDVISVGEVAVKVAEEYVGIGPKTHVLLIGTGETAAMVAKTLNQKKYAFDVTSMTIERATGFSKIMGGKPVKFEDVLAGFDKFDIIFVATTADFFLINYDRIKWVMKDKKKGTMILDISEPRVVDESVTKAPEIKLMFRDQIIETDERSLTARKNKEPDVEKLIAKELPNLETVMSKLEPEPIVSEPTDGIDVIRKKELEKAIQMLGETDEKKIKIIDELIKNVVESVIAIPPSSDTKKASEKK